MPRSPQVNFYLKPMDQDGKSVIFLQFKYSRRRLFFSFGEKIKLGEWNANKQRPKRKDFTTNDGSHSLSELLDNLQGVCERAYISEKSKGIPTTEALRRHLQEFLNYNIEQDEAEIDETTEDGEKRETNPFYILINRFISGEIKNRGKEKSENTLSNYHAVKQHLKAYEQKAKLKLTFDNITLDFFYSYVTFLKSLKNQKKEPLSQNTIAKDIRLLKVFMSEAVDLKLTKNLEYLNKKFSISEVETDAIYLSEKDIAKLYNYDFGGHKKLEQVRDLFVFGCYVGLRFSDYSTIEKNNIVSIDDDLFIKVKTEKTGELVIIPCNPVVLEIFKKYENNPNSLPNSVSNQKFNNYIKEACKQAGLTETGRLLTEPNLPLYESVSSHTARRSFATNLYLDGYPIIEIMKITGHKTEKAFMKYIRVTKLDAAKKLNEHMKKKWSEKTLNATNALLKAV